MKRIHAGFTLVELLVVITIIGILMGLLLPAVNAAREAARNNQCKTQLKNLALAAIQYENTKGEFPGWVMEFGRFAQGDDPANDGSDERLTGISDHQKIGTWAVALLPYLEAQPTYERWNQDRYPIIWASDENNGFNPNAAPSLAIMQCPSNPVAQGDIGQNSYVSNNGMYGANSDGYPTAGSMDRANGVFVNKFAGSTGVSIGPKVSLDDLKDGHGNTALFTENLQAMPWHRAGLIQKSHLQVASDATAAYPLNSRFTQGFVWHQVDPEGYGDFTGFNSEVHGINTTGGEDKYALEMTSSNAANLARPSAAHNGGVNMGFADGGTRFVTEGIDYRVYQALMTPRGKSSDVPFSEFVPTGDEF